MIHFDVGDSVAYCGVVFSSMTPGVVSKSMTCRDHDVIFPPCSTLVRASLDYVATLEPFSCEGYVKILGMFQRPGNNNY